VMESNGCPGYAWRVQATLYSPLQQALSFAVPLAPTLAASATPVALSGTCKMGPIGFALNGVPFYRSAGRGATRGGKGGEVEGRGERWREGGRGGGKGGEVEGRGRR
ncbi:unnamed protein product, partial [Closterium sp. Naga37s-1]